MAPIDQQQRGRQKKKALLVGATYEELHKKFPKENPPLRLPNAHKDPPVLKKLLIDKFGYDERDITILMDDGRHAPPTRDKMIKELRSLVENPRPGDHFVFSFSGHGSQVENTNNTEVDGKDEVIWPVDVVYDPDKPEDEKVTGYIIDDLLKEILVDNLPPKTRLTVLLDCCHSGTALDLPFNHSDDSLDGNWNSPIAIQAPENVFHGFEEPEEDDGEQGPRRGMSIQTVIAPSRSSTMTTKQTENRKNPRVIIRSMSMPYSTHGVATFNPVNGEIAVQEEIVSVARRTPPMRHPEPERLPHVTSWSACLDDQLGLDTVSGGILTSSLNSILREQQKRTNREMLNLLSQRLFDLGKKAKHYFRERKWDELPQPKPCLGSLRPPHMILDEEFTF